MQSDENNQSFNNLPPSAQEEIKRTIDREKLTSEIEQDLKTNPKYKPFFEQYHPSSIKNFIQHYKSKKTSWIVWGDLYKSIEQKKILKYYAIANQKIWEIQQKNFSTFNASGVQRLFSFRVFKPHTTLCTGNNSSVNVHSFRQ